MTKETIEKRGRKPIPDYQKKIPVTIFLPLNEVEILGGKELLKLKLLNYVTNNTERLQQTGTN